MPGGISKLLVVDDDDGLLLLMQRTLCEADYEVITASSGTQALERLRTHRPDLMLLDLGLNDIRAPDLLARLKRDNLAVPFIIVTGLDDQSVSTEMLRLGALDYVVKDTKMLDVLPSIVASALSKPGI